MVCDERREGGDREPRGHRAGAWHSVQSLWQPLVSQEEGGSRAVVGIQLPVQVAAHFLTSLETHWGRKTLQGGGKDGLDTGGRPELGGGIDASNRYLLALPCAGHCTVEPGAGQSQSLSRGNLHHGWGGRGDE